MVDNAFTAYKMLVKIWKDKQHSSPTLPTSQYKLTPQGQSLPTHKKGCHPNKAKGKDEQILAWFRDHSTLDCWWKDAKVWQVLTELRVDSP